MATRPTWSRPPDFDALNIDPDQFIPIIHLYFADDLTVA